MRQVSIRTYGGLEVLAFEDAPVPAAGPGELLVRVRAAGVNRADCLQREGTYPMPRRGTPSPRDDGGEREFREDRSRGRLTRAAAPGPRNAARREERYAAVELLLLGRCSSWLEPEHHPVSGSKPQPNSGRPPSGPTATTSSSHARSRSPPG